jgi:hypothetical protein
MKGACIMQNISLATLTWDTEKYYALKKFLEENGMDPQILDEVIEDRLRYEKTTILIFTSKH